MTARSATEEQRERQGIEELMGELNGQVEGLLMVWHLAAVAQDASTGSSQHLSINKEELGRKAEAPEH